MRTALFGQLAFRYEKKIQEIYKTVSDDILRECGKQIDDLLDRAAKTDLETLKKEYADDLEDDNT